VTKLRISSGLRRRLLAHFGDVGTGDECLAGTCDDDNADGGVLFQLFHDGQGGGNGLGIESVVHLWAVERQSCHVGISPGYQ